MSTLTGRKDRVSFWRMEAPFWGRGLLCPISDISVPPESISRIFDLSSQMPPRAAFLRFAHSVLNPLISYPLRWAPFQLVKSHFSGVFPGETEVGTPFRYAYRTC